MFCLNFIVIITEMIFELKIMLEIILVLIYLLYMIYKHVQPEIYNF